MPPAMLPRHMPPPCIRRTKPCSPLLSRIQGSRTVSGNAASPTAEDLNIWETIVVPTASSCQTRPASDYLFYLGLFDLLLERLLGEKPRQ